MKCRILQSLLIIIIFVSCKNDSKDHSDRNIKDVKKVIEVEKSRIRTSKIYKNDSTCKNFFEALDLSSLCITTKKSPKYRIEGKNTKNCQFQIYPDNNIGDIHVLVNFSDYKSSVYTTEDNPNGGEEMFKMMFKKKRTMKTFYTSYTNVASLGDDAFIGIHKQRNQKTLSVRLSNVTISIQIGRTDIKKICFLTDEEMKKMAQIILEKIKK